MALEEGTFGLGAAVFPLPSSTANSLLEDADPALFHALAFFSQVLATHLGARWTAAATAAGLDVATAASVVRSKVPYDPQAYMGREQFKLPMLAAFRVSETYTDKTMQWERQNGEWSVFWIMPPLSPAQAEQLTPMLRAVAATLRNRASLGFDPAHTPSGGDAGDNVWELANIDWGGFRSATYGNMLGAGNLTFPTVQMAMRMVERDEVPEGAFDALAGTDVAIDNVDQVNGTYNDVANISTTHNRAFSSAFSTAFH